MNKIAITNPQKVLYPRDKISKLDVVRYYVDICDKMLKFVKDRPLSVIRCHQDIDGEKFFKKHPLADKHIHTFKFKSQEYFFVKTKAEIVAQVQNGTIEFHPWASFVQKIDCPRQMIFDLDPDKSISIKKLRGAVKKIKLLLDELGLKSFLKTSGGKGYHIVVPFQKVSNWQNFYAFSKNVALIAEERWSETFTTNIKIASRKGKIFVDYLRNNMGSTCVAPFSLRARDGATISMPIYWQDLDKILPNQVTIKNYKKYINDSWKNFFLSKQSLT